MNKPSILSSMCFFPANEGGSELECHHAPAEVVLFIFYTLFLLTSEALVQRW